MLCQETTLEQLKCPANSKNTANIADVYTNTAALLKRFIDAEKIPTTFHKRLIHFLSTAPDAGKTFLEKKVSWHSSCKSLITESKYKLCLKRKNDDAPEPAAAEKKVTRSQIPKFESNMCSCTSKSSKIKDPSKQTGDNG